MLEAVDLKLGENFDKHEMERLLVLGLRCAQHDSELRPSIREAIQVLNFEAPLPCFQYCRRPLYQEEHTKARQSIFPLLPP